MPSSWRPSSAPASRRDLSIQDYYTKLKRLADQLRDVGHPVSEPSQVFNLLCGLSPRYRHVKPVIKSKSPPHTFRSAMSYLLLEEASDDHDAKTQAGHALYAGRGGSSAPTTGSGRYGDSGPRSGSGGGSNRSKRSARQRSKGSNSGSGGMPPAGGRSSATAPSQRPPAG